MKKITPESEKTNNRKPNNSSEPMAEAKLNVQVKTQVKLSPLTTDQAANYETTYSKVRLAGVGS